MRVRNATWKIHTLMGLQSRIESQPLYQRGEVWSLEMRQLLIDSIVRQYDVPKVYLHKLDHNALYEYQIVDGQQRLTSIWRYVNDSDDGYALSKKIAPDTPWAGKSFSQLSSQLQQRILNFPLVVAIIEQAKDDEVRELFARLQKAAQLNCAELRNSIRSAIGTEIRAMALTHPFFPASRFSERRYKHHDLIAHAFALELYGYSHDIKAPDLKAMYLEYADAVPRGLAPRVNHNLMFMKQMLDSIPNCISRKWGFVDSYLLVGLGRRKLPSPSMLASKYATFEEDRLKHVARPEVLLQGHRKDQALYDYIMAFKLEAGTADKLRIRHNVLKTKLLD